MVPSALAARAQLALDAVAVGQGGREAFAHAARLGVAEITGLEVATRYRLPPLSATRRRSSVIQLGDTTSWKLSLSDRIARTRLPSRVTS